MTARDRLMLTAMLALAIVVGGYVMVVSPERKAAAKASAEVATERQQLQAAEAQAAEATSARNRYAAAYSSLVSLGPAVPASGETPSLLYALASATHSRNVDFQSITAGSGSSGSTSSSAGAAASAAAFTQKPFSFVFLGSFQNLYKLLHELEGFTNQTTSGSLHVSGRLLTIDGIQLVGNQEGTANGKSGSKQQLRVTVTATAYVLPSGQSALAGATPTAPAGVSPASASAGSSSPTTPAVVRAAP
jgi:Tfp pilus assembly protein PilO